MNKTKSVIFISLSFCFFLVLSLFFFLTSENVYAETIVVKMIIEGKEYEERVNVEYPARGVVDDYGSFEAYAESLLGKVEKERIFNYLDEGFGTRFFHILSDLETPPVNAKLEVNDKKPYFRYKKGVNGFVFGEKEAVVALGEALDGKVPTLSLKETPPEITVKTLKEKTRLKSRFSTSIATSSIDRAHNVALALSSINGVILAPYERFSFNEKVGERSEKRGYRNAKVISSGEYVDGIGGGVCQAATTLYVAALKAGMTVNKASHHTYRPSYVPPSFDAMVSSYSDLVFTNDDETTYLFAGREGDIVYVEFYGEEKEKIVLKNEIIEEYPHEVVYENCAPENDEVEKVKSGIDGVKSRLYLLKNGRKILLRENVYKSHPEIYAKKQE